MSNDEEMAKKVKLAQQDVAELRTKITKLDDPSLDLMFRRARSHNKWQDKSVSDEKLKDLYELMKWGPTANNICPIRIIFVKSDEAKEKLVTCLMPNNENKVRTAPVVAILGHDLKFYEQMPRLLPHRPDANKRFIENPNLVQPVAFRNSSLQGAYFMFAARAIGLDTGPMSGFKNPMVDEKFFGGTDIKSNFICALGYADETGIFQRLPRFEFDEVCQII
ncbi:MAG: malonic semialdehyde reductase [Rhodospirillales bacterium]|nr:malonic semialdehyde reductase [Rhodospirillales bacterium]